MKQTDTLVYNSLRQILNLQIHRSIRRLTYNGILMNYTFYGCASITASKRKQIENHQHAPCPTTYDPSKEDSFRIPKWTLKPKIDLTSCFASSKPYVPAPGAYDIDPPKKVRPAYKEREFKPVKDKVNPDKSCHLSNVNLPSSIQNTVGHSFGYRSEVVVKESSPGPIYNVVQNTIAVRVSDHHHKSCSNFGFGERTQARKDQIAFPGPGNYLSEQYKAHQGYTWSMGKASRNSHKKNMINLGPGEYDINKLSWTGKGCTIKAKYREPQTELYKASPALYDVPDTRNKKGAIFRLGAKNKENRHQDMPSPFSYDPVPTTLKPSGCSLGQRFEEMEVEELPGPGAYDVIKDLDSFKGGYMGRKTVKQRQISSDNFYKYNPKFDAVSNQPPKYTFSQNFCAENQGKTSPLGPGSYTLKYKSPEGPTIPKETRFKAMKRERGGHKMNEKNAQSTIGYLPSYLQPRHNKNHSNISNTDKECNDN